MELVRRGSGCGNSRKTGMKKIVFTALVVVFALSAGACNTVRGIGEDVQAGGRAIEKAAK